MAVTQKTFEKLAELKKQPGLPTSVPGRMLHHVSPSQVSTFRDCPRKWFLETVHGIRQPETESQRLGTEVHLVLEQLIHDEPVQGSQRAIDVASSGQHLLPPPGTPCQTEVEFVLRDPRVPLPLYGFIDLVTPEYAADHKTTSNIGLYAKSEYQWQTDPQPVIYSAQQLSIGQHKDFRVNYFQTRGSRKATHVQIRMSKETIDFGMEAIGQDVTKMVQFALLPEEEVPYGPQGENTTDACDKYGGCHLKMRCLSHGVVPEGMGAYQETAQALATVFAQPTTTTTRSPEMSQVMSAKERLALARARSMQLASDAETAPQEAPGINPPQLPGDLPLDQAPDVAADVAQEEAAQPLPQLPPAPPAPPAPPRKQRTRAVEPPLAAPEAAMPAVSAVGPDAPVQEPAPLNVPVSIQDLEVAVSLASSALDKMVLAQSDLEKRAKRYLALLEDGDEDAQELYDKAKERLEAHKRATETHRKVLAEAEQAHKEGLQKLAQQKKAEDEARKRKEAQALRQIAPDPVAVELTLPAAAPVEPVVPSSAIRTLYLGCSPSMTKDITYFDQWVQPYLQRAAAARQVPYYRMIPHGAVDAVITEIVADLRSGKAPVPTNLVFREFAAQHYPYVQDLVPFYNEVVR